MDVKSSVMPAAYAPYLRYICICPCPSGRTHAYRTYCFDTLSEAQKMMAQNPDIDWRFMDNSHLSGQDIEPDIETQFIFDVTMAEACHIYEEIHGTPDTPASL